MEVRARLLGRIIMGPVATRHWLGAKVGVNVQPLKLS